MGALKQWHRLGAPTSGILELSLHPHPQVFLGETRWSGVMLVVVVVMVTVMMLESDDGVDLGD